MRRLGLLRHARALPAGPDGDDLGRPLSDAGRSEAMAIARVMAEGRRFVPERVLCSPARRTRQTSAIVAGWLVDGAVEFDGRLYLADADRLLEALKGVPSSVGELLVVGHNPGLESLLAGLTGMAADDLLGGGRLGTADLAVLEIESPWTGMRPGAARFAGLYHPCPSRDGGARP